MIAPENLDLKGMQQEIERFTEFVKSAPDLLKLREEVRTRIGTTPRDLVYKEHSVTVHKYRRSTPATVKTPLLLLYSLVNRAYVFDLYEGESFVQALLDRGLEVYVLEWGEPNPAQADLTIEYYLKHYLGRAIRRVLRNAGTDQLTLAGYCLGGTLALLYAALDKGETVKNLVTMVTPVGFHDAGLMSWWAQPEHFKVDKLVDAFGNLPAQYFALTFPWIVPTADLKKARALYEKRHDRKFLESLLALDIWGRDNTGFPGQVYREIITRGYHEDTLVMTGEWPLDTTSARMADIEMPILNLAAQHDHLCVTDSVLVLSELVGSKDCISKAYPTGHLGIALGKDATNQHTDEYWDELSSWLTAHDA